MHDKERIKELHIFKVLQAYLFSDVESQSKGNVSIVYNKMAYFMPKMTKEGAIPKQKKWDSFWDK